VRVYHQGRFLCRAICQELADRSVGLKDIIRARSERRRQLRAGLSEREALVEALLAVHRPPPEPEPALPDTPPTVPAAPPLKRYYNE
jgi:putative transposase